MNSSPKYAAVLFDCDGVLVDSERLTNTVLWEMLNELGWQISREECVSRFVGKMLRDEADVIEEQSGFRIDAQWLSEFRGRRNDALEASLEAIPGVAEAVRALDTAYPGRLACASSADRSKINLQLQKIGLLDAFDGRIFSGMELPQSKPAPDVYLAAANALGVDPVKTAVIEDSPTGVTAGVAAGAHVLGFCPDSPVHQRPEALEGVGAHEIFTAMDQLPGLLLH
ncbi:MULTISPECIES: HAD family phosphatase [Brevibacterium]|uniref:Haloacid dehalogenase superfamily, subfamily IA, variant 3 with third motif having DD or ED n=3 Tax=Brevibacterium TaxID=1696 RepID=A0A2H1I8Q4_9MICO|nr:MULTISPECIES: HAD family phosphatase [Brevibacterium]SMX71589.1 haloacid dehalogenase superfamily, subfamily IA, variant 3 with third motif having DD or ED [Brevibacterium antiquum CNRZ 918]SMX81011.1 haloacid dehalogenase superfamily, subfamily IA, variant 3 with third motif having DD or ED [Brevibacterium antiquum]HCG54629.1 HAD family phosphatase [Brevibacterium sp.]